MKAGWEVKALGDAFQTVTGNTPSKSKKHYYGNDVPLVKPPELTNGEVYEALDGLTDEGAANARVAPQGSVLVSCIGNLGKIGLATRPLAFNQQINAIYPDETVSIPKFIFYFTLSPQFTAQLADLAAGTTVPIVNKSRFNSIEISLPPLKEQKRIVAVLDAAFEGLTRARTHVETNLQNARELFDSQLHETFRIEHEDWASFTVGETYLKTKVPAKIQRKHYLDEGLFPIVSQESDAINGYWNKQEDVIKVGKPLVVFGDHTRALKFVDFDFVVGADGTQILLPRSDFDSRFYFFALRSIDLAGKGYARHFSHLKKERIWVPTTLSEQVKIGLHLEQSEEYVENARHSYRAKLQDLDDLRQSLLARAFAGELT